MKQIADDLYLLDGFPPNAVNVYLMGGVLVDAATRYERGRILRQLRGRTVTAHALTHAHPDHQGASHAICTELGIPYWVPAGDADAAESGDLTAMCPSNAITRAMNRVAGPGHPVARRLHEGDEVGGFVVMDAPGHSPGQAAYWRASDGVLVLGDVLNGMNLITTMKGLHEPPRVFTVNPAQNRDSARKLAALQPRVVCFGHGPVWTDPEGFQRFVATLP